MSETALEPDILSSVQVRLYRSTNTPTGIDPRGAQTIINSVKQEIHTTAYVEFCPKHNPSAQADLVDEVIKLISKNLD